MSDLFLDLRNYEQALDFIADAIEYLGSVARKHAEQELAKVEAHGPLTTEELAMLAKDVGRKSWPARHALQVYLSSPSGCDLEWRKAVSAVSDSTAHILERFRHGTKCEAMDEVLSHDESASAFRDLERFEIAEVRRHVRHQIWREKHRELEKDVIAADKKLAAIVKRLDALRELAGDAPWIQDEIMSKLERFEDRLYFEGEELDAEILDEEIKYYREEKEVPTGER
ncbi:MAG TPA: hypothetical protein VN397_03845 [Candidatus Methylomirabilis sp.]|nr:hypothetical protein [Candidatus Methylomirabilis sp.]